MLFLRKVLVELVILYNLAAGGALSRLVVFLIFDNGLPQTIDMTSVPTLSALDHRGIVVLLIEGSYLLVTELTVPLFGIFLHLEQDGLGPLSLIVVHACKRVINIDFLVVVFRFFFLHA